MISNVNFCNNDMSIDFENSLVSKERNVGAGAVVSGQWGLIFTYGRNFHLLEIGLLCLDRYVLMHILFLLYLFSHYISKNPVESKQIFWEKNYLMLFPGRSLTP